jgi:hypothetical protein
MKGESMSHEEAYNYERELAELEDRLDESTIRRFEQQAKEIYDMEKR